MKQPLKIQFNTQIWKEGNVYVSYVPQLEVASCGETVAEAKKNIREATELFLEGAEEMGTLNQILEEAGVIFDKEWKAPEMIVAERMELVH